MGHRISPTTGEFETAREIVATSLDDAEATLPLDRDVVVELGWDGDEHVPELLDGASGFASYPNRIELGFNTAAENWRGSLRSATVHEYAHIWGYEQRGRESDTKWEYVLEEAFTQHTASALVPEYRSPWWTRHDRRTVAAHWGQIKEEELHRDSEEAGPVFIDPDDGGYPLGLGYSLSFQIGRELLEDHELRDLPTLEKPAVVGAGDRLYQGET